MPDHKHKSSKQGKRTGSKKARRKEPARKAATALGRDSATGQFMSSARASRVARSQQVKTHKRTMRATKVVESVQNAVDAIESLAYQEGVKGVIAMDEFDYLKEIIASRYGVPVENITSEFLKAKRLEREDELDEYYEEMEKRYGIKFDKFEPRSVRNTP